MGTAATGMGMLAIAMATGAVTAMDVATVGTAATGMAAATAGTGMGSVVTGMGIAVTVDPLVWRIQAGGRRGARPSVA